jgi:amidase
MPEEVLSKSALEQAELVRSGEVSSRELVEASLARIERLNGELNAFVTLVEERALAEADRVRPGDERPFAGVPIAIKDLVAWTEGIRTTFGTNAAGDFVPPFDTSIIQKLRGAGTIIVGKTNLPELGILPVTEPDRFGPTRNPWDPSRTPGGSSGGSGAAVASRMTALGHGGDGGGSLRIPASCCGLVGLKATRGRISGAPIAADHLAGVAIEGVLTRTVADNAAILDVISGSELGDWHHLPDPETPFAEAPRQEPGRLRIAFTIEPPNGVPVHPECERAVREAAALLESLGHHVDERAPDWKDEAFIKQFIVFWNAQTAANVAQLSALLGDDFDPSGLEALTRRMVEMAEGTSARDYVLAYDYVRTASRRIMSLWNEYDLLLTPTLAQPPLEIGALRPDEGEDPLTMLSKSSAFVPFTPAFNVTGQPAISLPLHQSAEGLPIGVQLVGAPAREDLLLSLSAQLEQARPWGGRRPEFATA